MAKSLPANESPRSDFLQSPQRVSESNSCSGGESGSMTAVTTNTSHTTTNGDPEPPGEETEVREATEGSKKGNGVKFEGHLAPANDDEDVDDLSDPDDKEPAHGNRYTDSRSGHGPAPPPKPLKERILKAPNQVKQILQYTKLMEDRVQALEAQMKAMIDIQVNPTTANVADADNKEADNTDADNTDADNTDADNTDADSTTSNSITSAAKSEPSLSSLVIPHTKRGGEDSYKKRHTGDKDATYLIDVWIPDESEVTPEKLPSSLESSVKSTRDDVPPRDRQPSISDHPKSPRITKTNLETAYLRPKRLRINSERLLAELYKVTGQAAALRLDQFLPPFQLFALYEKDIRQHLSDLELECLGDSPVTAEVPSVQDSTNAVSIQGSTKPAATDIGQDHASNDPGYQDGVKDTDNAKEKEAPAIHHDKDVVSSDEIVDERYGEGEKVLDRDLLEIMETCLVSRGRAAKMLKEALTVDESIKRIQAIIASVAQRTHAKALLPEWKVLVALLDEDLKIDFGYLFADP